MSTSPVPAKQDVPKSLWEVASTLTKEAQDAALRKCRDLGFDTNRGRISLEETLINLSEARDVVLDAVEKKKITELPLNLQYSLLEQVRRVGEQLVALTNGTDAISALENATEELTASIWMFQLRNLSGQVLGLQTKMNQLKGLEIVLREASREANKFAESREFAAVLLDQIKVTAEAAAGARISVEQSVAKTNDILQLCAEAQQKIAALAAQVQQSEITTAQQTASATQAAANLQATEKSAKDTAGEITTLRAGLDDLQRKAQELIGNTESTTRAQIDAHKAVFASLKETSEKKLAELMDTADKHAADLTTTVNQKLENTTTAIQTSSSDLENRITKLSTDTAARLTEAEKTHEGKLQTQLTDFDTKHKEALASLAATLGDQVKAFSTEKDAVMEQNKVQFQGLVDNLNELEGRIRESIGRATGYSLFHSFQTRQEALRVSSRFWMKALAGALFLALVMGGFLIYELRSTPVNGIFFLRLALSIPLFYAVGFCTVQYGRERRLEEEYAFKANISISLDPYQQLVRKLVKDDNSTEMEKYTSFIIDSITKVFTSPTDKIFDSTEKEKSGPKVSNKALKQAVELMGAFVKEIKH